jgi:MPBQ/MSBQ methyltransferase
MAERDLVNDHYARSELTETILAALAEHGIDIDHLTVQDLYPVDQLHAGFAAATEYVVGRLGLGPDADLLDIGCGIGGPSRLAATTTSARVTGIDLSSDFVGAARRLTERVGLADRVSHEIAAALAMPFEDDTFDAAMMIHVGMNMPDKTAVFTEVHRVLRPGSRFAVLEQMRVGPGDLPYPMPWGDDERSSFVETAEQYAAHLTAAGFAVEDVEDRTAATVAVSPGGPAGLSPQIVFGPEFEKRIANNIAGTRSGILGAVLVLARA